MSNKEPLNQEKVEAIVKRDSLAKKSIVAGLQYDDEELAGQGIIELIKAMLSGVPYVGPVAALAVERAWVNSDEMKEHKVKLKAKDQAERQAALDALEAAIASHIFGLIAEVRHLQPIDEYASQRDQVRQVILEELSYWGQCHAFGNQQYDPGHSHDGTGVPFMPLDEIYVEPITTKGKKILSWLGNGLSSGKKVLVVTADFGHGKSLTARRLARDLAKARLEDPTQPFPVFAKCSDHLSPSVDLEAITRGGLHDIANDANAPLADDHPVFAPFGPDEPMVYVLDGLDEIHLGSQEYEEVFKKLKAKSSEKRRFVVLTRPKIVPSGVAEDKQVSLCELSSFNHEQIVDWLERWATIAKWPTEKDSDLTAANAVQTLGAKGLLDEAKVPVLLFMLAFSWRDLVQDENLSKSDIYEHFFRRIARGKLEDDPLPGHPVVAEAAEDLLKVLQKKGILSDDLSGETGGIEAMLWLMSRAAWMSHGLDQREEPIHLKARHIERFVEEELGVSEDKTQLICIGLLLSLQADFRHSGKRILFGHKSFREFLVARFWASTIKRIISAPSKDHLGLEKPLIEARLFAPEDQSFERLIEILGGKGFTEKTKDVLKWAKSGFDDLSRDPLLKEVMLGLGHRVGTEQFDLNIGALRHLVAYLWAGNLELNLYLIGAHLKRAHLIGAFLQGANLRSAFLQDANLKDTDLRGADLGDANLERADLRSADLRGADLERANLERANLRGADFRGADLGDAKLRGAFLQDANLFNTHLGGANLERANLERANLEFALLLKKANLGGANLERANLRSAFLQGADLRDTNLRDADLRNTDLRDTNLIDASYDKSTRWPQGFDPEAAGAIKVD